ncbi:Uncharacterised protein [Legionella wadsworthii]|uniref:Uncharacterized protein n=2 Tax=Legionella wadsworthii TaxID=28088 RepID=A0A378LWJ9_9GAMM|nr:Uncharacterised protein [Legionella wadsworthii]
MTTVIITTAKIDIRCALIKYLLDPSSQNLKELRRTCMELHTEALKEIAQLALEKAQKTRKEARLGDMDVEVDNDKINIKIDELVGPAIEGIFVTRDQLEALKIIMDNLPKMDVKFGIVLTILNQQLEKQIASDDHYKAFAAIYPIELDAHRIKKDDKQAGRAAITLSRKLLKITSRISQANQLTQIDEKSITQAYADAQGHGIEKHRGFKEKFFNFCRILSCIYPPNYFHYKSQPSFWTTVKTKTQEDIDKSQEALDIFQQSFKINKTC